MAEAFINSICKLIMIAGEQTPAPYVGVSAQIDVMQDFMEDDLMPVFEAGGSPDPPEITELKGEVAKTEAESDLFEKVTDFLFPSQYGPIFRGGTEQEEQNAETQNIEQSLKHLFQTISEGQSRGDEGNTSTVDPAQPRTWSFAKIAPLIVATGTVATQYGDQIARGIKYVMPGLAKIGAAVAKYAPKVSALIGRLAPGALAALMPILGTFGDKFKTIATVLGTIAQMISEFMQTYMMVSQFQNLNDYARYLSPELGMFLDTPKNVEEVLSNQYEQDTQTRSVAESDAKEDTGTPEEGSSRGTIQPGTVIPSMKVSVPNIPNIQDFTLNTGLRMLIQRLPVYEALLKKLILSLNSKIDAPDAPPKMYSITDILYRSLNYDRPSSMGGMAGPAVEMSLAEILSRGIPLIETIDPISKKRTYQSVLELFMQAQNAKVIELGPGFLKWYTELDVLQHDQAVTTTPVTGV